MKNLRRLGLFLLGATAAIRAQTTDVSPGPAPVRGETAVTLDVGFGIRAVRTSRITVPAGEALRITAPNLGSAANHQWTKNGRALAGRTGNVLVLDPVAPADAGTYVCIYSTATSVAQPSQSLILGVGPTDRLLNLASRANIGGTNPDLIAGFVVAATSPGKKLILRAVGPGLAAFGITTPLRTPVLRIFDGNGKPYENGYAYPAVVGGPTYESDLADALGRTGAFPLAAGTRDVVVMMPFLPGNYTAQVSSGDGGTGTVLLEIYEVP